MEKIIANQIRTPDGTVLRSYHVHDYKTYTDKNGKEYMVDGGLQYLRRNVHDDAPYEELSVYLNDPFEQVREVFEWGTYGPEGKGPFRRVKLKDMDVDHIQAILETQPHVQNSWMKEVFEKELEFRGNND